METIYMIISIVFYVCGALSYFFIHQIFDGGIVYSTRKEGPLFGAVLSLFWPLLIVIIIAIVGFQLIRGR